MAAVVQIPNPDHPRHTLRQIAFNLREAADCLHYLAVLTTEEGKPDAVEVSQDLDDRADHDRDDAAFFDAMADLTPPAPKA